MRWERTHGRPGLCGAADQHLRRTGAGLARAGAVVSGTSDLANIVAGVLALGLLVYLFVALTRPEKF
nr:hypothetical protein [Kibdelosporangium sp. MJ126-NF4]CTQ92162.1 hypothetical protein [Kibdelosporangium sp. MJ126-NF4]